MCPGVGSRCLPWGPIASHGVPLPPVGYHCLPWGTIASRGVPLPPVGSHCLPWGPIASHCLPWGPIASHGVPLPPVGSHWVPSPPKTNCCLGSRAGVILYLFSKMWIIYCSLILPGVKEQREIDFWLLFFSKKTVKNYWFFLESN